MQTRPLNSPLLTLRSVTPKRTARVRDPFRLRGNDAGEVRSELAGDVPGRILGGSVDEHHEVGVRAG